MTMRQKQIAYCNEHIRPLLTNYQVVNSWGFFASNTEVDLGILPTIESYLVCNKEKYRMSYQILGKLRKGAWLACEK
jgi:hypothetical protein